MVRLSFILCLVGASIGSSVAHEPSITFDCECLLQKNEHPNGTTFTFEQRQHWSDVQAYYQKICGPGVLLYRGQTLLPETPLGHISQAPLYHVPQQTGARIPALEECMRQAHVPTKEEFFILAAFVSHIFAREWDRARAFYHQLPPYLKEEEQIETLALYLQAHSRTVKSLFLKEEDLLKTQGQCRDTSHTLLDRLGIKGALWRDIEEKYMRFNGPGRLLLNGRKVPQGRGPSFRELRQKDALKFQCLYPDSVRVLVMLGVISEGIAQGRFQEVGKILRGHLEDFFLVKSDFYKRIASFLSSLSRSDTVSFPCTALPKSMSK